MERAFLRLHSLSKEWPPPPLLLSLSLCVSLTQTNNPAWILQSQTGSEDADVRRYSSVLTRFGWFATVRLMRGAAGPRHWSAETTKHKTPFQNKSLSWFLRTSAQLEQCTMRDQSAQRRAVSIRKHGRFQIAYMLGDSGSMIEKQ